MQANKHDHCYLFKLCVPIEELEGKKNGLNILFQIALARRGYNYVMCIYMVIYHRSVDRKWLQE